MKRERENLPPLEEDIKNIGGTYIPAFISNDPRLELSETVLWGRIYCLTGVKGYCFASNGWLAKVLRLKPGTISNMISKLNRLGLVNVEIIRNSSKQVIERRIYPVTPTFTPKEAYPSRNGEGIHLEMDRSPSRNGEGIHLEMEERVRDRVLREEKDKEKEGGASAPPLSPSSETQNQSSSHGESKSNPSQADSKGSPPNPLPSKPKKETKNRVGEDSIKYFPSEIRRARGFIRKWNEFCQYRRDHTKGTPIEKLTQNGFKAEVTAMLKLVSNDPQILMEALDLTMRKNWLSIETYTIAELNKSKQPTNGRRNGNGTNNGNANGSNWIRPSIENAKPYSMMNDPRLIIFDNTH